MKQILFTLTIFLLLSCEKDRSMDTMTGKWFVTTETEEFELTLTQDGRKLSGIAGSINVPTTGNIIGNDVMFSFNIKYPLAKHTYTGTVNADFNFMTGTVTNTADPSVKSWDAHKMSN